MKICIGIPTVNGPQRLRRCLKSIWDSTDFDKFDFKVLAIDDGSAEVHLKENQEICASFGINLLMNNARLGVATSWNKLTRHYPETELMILLNDDIEVVRDWLDAIVYTVENNLQIGTVGLNAYEGDRPEKVFTPTYCESKLMFGGMTTPILACRGYAFAFRVSDFNSVNGFDEQYFCFFEEVDFCLSLLNKGKRSTILSYPLVYHGHGLTTKSILEDPKQIFEESKKKFEEKWQISWKYLREKFSYLSLPSIPDIINEWNSNIRIWN